MNDFESKTTSQGQEVNRASVGVQCQLNWLQAGLILLSALFTFCVWLQVHYLGIERANLQPFFQSYDRDKQAVDPLLAKIVEYGRTHTAFAPIMLRYNITVPTNVAVAPTVGKPAGPAAAKPAAPPKK